MNKDTHELPFWEYEATRKPGDSDARSNLTRDVAFNRKSIMADHQRSPYDNGVVAVGTDRIEVRLVQGVPDSFINVLAKATKATLGLEPGDDEEPSREDAEEMLKGGLQTALEAAVVVFEVRGVSRTCTHQLVRTRKAAFHQQSQRASYVGDRPEVRMPESVWRNKRARIAFMEALDAAHDAYRIITDEDISFQDARFILPEGTNNYILLEYPLREFINVFNYRGCSMFQWEIVDVMRKCRDVLVEAHPWLEPHVKISCERTHEDPAQRRCTFQGWESVDEQCDLEWGRDENRTYKPREDLSIKKKSLPVVTTTEPKEA